MLQCCLGCDEDVSEHCVLQCCYGLHGQNKHLVLHFTFAAIAAHCLRMIQPVFCLDLAFDTWIVAECYDHHVC